MGFDTAAYREDHRRVAEAADPTGPPRSTTRIGGLDAAYPGDVAVGAAVLWDPDAEAVTADARGLDRQPEPYVPGYLFARELPALVAALRGLGLDRARQVPWLVDGHGRLHPKRAGLACHLGVELDLQTVGVAKSPLVTDEREGRDPGEARPLRVDGTLLGYALRPTAEAENPIYVSPGHDVGPEEALALVRPLCRHRVPEPVRRADAHASEVGEGRR
jgi:deoxyribonuclease V